MGMLFDIRRYSVHDGPGIRTALFFKGCPLNCLWCHNPESILIDPQPIVRERHLDGEKELITETVGKEYTTAEVMKIIERDLPFYEESDGGVTFSGGEPLLQPEFLLGLLNQCKESGIHTAIDTSGHAKEEIFMEVARNTDLMLFDIKSADPKLHKELAGESNERILRNLFALREIKTPVWIRIPVIPGFNNTVSDMEQICKLLDESGVSADAVHLLPYHRLGKQKYEALGMQKPPVFAPATSAETMKKLTMVFEKGGYRVKFGG